MVRAEARADERELLRSSDRTSRAGGSARSSGNSFADGWSEPSLQKAGLSGGPDARGEPDATLARRTSGCARWSGCSRSLRRPSTATAHRDRRFDAGGVFGSRTGSLHLARRVAAPDRAPGGIGAHLERAVDQAVGVDRGIAPVGRDLVVQVGLRVGPVPQRDDDVALDALRPRRLRGGTSPAAMRSVQSANSSQRALRAEPVDAVDHLAPACPDWMRRVPRLGRGLRTCRAPSGISRVALLPSWWQA